MPVVDIDGGFEADPSPWSLAGAGCSITTGNPRGGVNALRMFTTGDPDLDPAGSAICSQNVSLKLNTEYLVSLWASGQDYTAGGGALQLFNRTESLGTITPAADPRYRRQFFAIFKTALSTDTLFIFSSSTGISSTLWVDDVRLEEATHVAKQKAIRTELEQDLAAIPGATIVDKLKPDSATGDRYITFVPRDGSGQDAEDASFRSIRGDVLFTVKSNVIGSRDDADDWIDTIKNAVENGNTQGLPFVESVRGSEWESNIGNSNTWNVEVAVSVRYTYRRGEA